MTVKNRSRVLILSHISQFSLGCDSGGFPYAGLKDMRFHFCEDGASTPVIGDLVALHSAPPSKWYLGWLQGIAKAPDHFGTKYAIESLEDGEVCDWSNVGLRYYDRSQVSHHPEWRWDDQQHEFNDRWKRVCYKERDAHWYLPKQVAFDQDSGVTLGVRVRHTPEVIPFETHFSAWKKLTKRDMLKAYDDAVAHLASKGRAI